MIRKVETSKWASPTVPVLKPDGSVRICADYSRTVNVSSDCEQYPLPTLEEMLAKLSEGEKFTKLDLSQAYHQLELDPESRPYTTISTHKGLYEYVRLPFGIHSTVSIFQRTMETLLADIPGCMVYVDDILVTGRDDDDHRENLSRVLTRLQEAGLKLKSEKFDFMLDEISYLGHTISAQGLTPDPSKIDAMMNANAPTSVNELQSLIGSANYLRRFIPHFATKMAPLYALLKKDVPWKWGKEEESAFTEIREALCSAEILAHYSLTKDTVVQTDASGKGLGAVLLQKQEDGALRPVAYASRVLSKAEMGYSNIERESLAVIFGVTKFRQYLLGRKFTVQTDHRPLLKLLGSNESVPSLVSARLKKWKLVLTAYDYEIQYLPGKENVLADFLSRKPMEGQPSTDEKVDVQVLFTETEHEVVNAATIVAETRKDPVLKKVLQHTIHGWPETSDVELLPYFTKCWELSVSEGILLWNECVIVPPSLRDVLLMDLHAEHSGAVRMKRLARRYIWWPKMEEAIESMVKECTACQSNARMPAKEHGSWSWPLGPWQRLHLDFAGPFMGKMFLVLVDAYSKYIDIIPMNHATSESTISALHRNFAIFGLPTHIVTDNGSQFTSEEFQTFLRKNSIYHTCSAPGHPATNGLAERYVGYFKAKFRAMGDSGSLSTKLHRFLLMHRSTPTANGKSPAELLMNRQPRLLFDVMRGNNRRNIDVYEANMGQTPEFVIGQPVFALNFNKFTDKWVPATIAAIISPTSYQVQVGDVLWKRHRNQLRPRSVSSAHFDRPQASALSSIQPHLSSTLLQPTPTVTTPAITSEQAQPMSPASPTSDAASENSNSSASDKLPSTATSRPKRSITKPVRFRDT